MPALAPQVTNGNHTQSQLPARANHMPGTRCPPLAPQMIFSGYILPYNNIPSYFKFLYYASFWQYCLGILQINEFEDRIYTVGGGPCVMMVP